MLSVRILVVEDERKLAQALQTALKAEHYEVVVATTGEDGFMQHIALRGPLIIGGTLKIGYDLLLYRAFRHVRPRRRRSRFLDARASPPACN